MKYGKDTLNELTGKQRLGQNRQSEYLGAEDIDPGTEPVLTISGIYNGMVTLQMGKENKDVLGFHEASVPGILHVRPMIVNSTNRKTLKKLYGAVDADTLKDKPVQLYIDHNVRDPQNGGKTDGIRIRPFAPRVQAPIPPCADCGGEIKAAWGKDARYLAAYTEKNYGAPLCADCAQKRKEAQKAAAEAQSLDADEPTPENKEALDVNE